MQKTPIRVYEPAVKGGEQAYDEAMAAVCLQGLINRDAPRLYVVSSANARPQYWLDLFTRDGEWLAGRERPLFPACFLRSIPTCACSI